MNKHSFKINLGVSGNPKPGVHLIVRPGKRRLREDERIKEFLKRKEVSL